MAALHRLLPLIVLAGVLPSNTLYAQQTYTWDEVLGATSAISDKFSYVCLRNVGSRSAQIDASMSANIPSNMRISLPEEGASFCGLMGLSEEKRSAKKILRRIRFDNPHIEFLDEVHRKDRSTAVAVISSRNYYLDICVSKKEDKRLFIVEIAEERRDECPSS